MKWRGRFAMIGLTLLFAGLVGHRVWRYATFAVPAMPRQMADDEERELFLTPGGGYTLADITENGRATPTQQYRGFKASHDFNPRPGDTICPVTRTKANRECTWIIGGGKYEFCCPPCIAEFVRQAKENPQQIKSPAEYVVSQ